MRRILIDLTKFALSAGLIWLAFSNIDGARAFSLLQTLHPGIIVAAVALLALQHVLGGLRFHQLMVQVQAPISRQVAVENAFVGIFFSQVFISFIGGDAVRIWRLVDGKVPMANAFRAVLFDRVLGFVSVMVLILLCVPVLFGLIADQAMRAGLLLAVLIGMLATLAFLMMHRLPAWLRRRRVFQAASDISVLALGISRQPAVAAYLFGLSLLIHVINVAAIFLIARGLGDTPGFMNFLALIPPVMLLAILPISFAGWGVREGSMVLALGLVGIGPERSVAISVCFGLCLLASGLPGGISLLRARKARPE